MATPALPPQRRLKRRHPRADLPATAILFTDRRPVGPCLILDVSGGGLRLVAGRPIRRGRVVSALLDLPGKAPFVAFAQVVRQEKRAPREYHLGLSFLNLPRADLERLEGLVAGTLAQRHLCLEFFDTEDEGCAKRLVVTDDSPVVERTTK